jgi:hypothetical protein
MATLSEVRDRLRTRLEDTSVAPLWSDTTLDEGLKRALDAYSQWSPSESVTTFTAADGDTSASLPSGGAPAGGSRVLEVIDPNGWTIPPLTGERLRYSGDEELSWSVFAGSLRFARPLISGTYTVYTTGARAWPASDDDDFPVPESDLSLILSGAAVYALEVRATQEWKRGPLPARYSEAISEARSAYAAEWRERRRVIRVHRLSSTN